MKLKNVSAKLILFVLALTIGGGVYLLFHLGLFSAFGGTIPHKPLLKWVFLALLTGAVFAVGEFFIGHRFAAKDKITDPLWKRTLRLIIILCVAGIVAIILCWALSL